MEPQAVVVKDLAIEKPEDGLEADMWVRRDVHRLAGRKRQGAKGIAVRAQLEDLPHDSEAPPFPIGSGLGCPTRR